MITIRNERSTDIAARECLLDAALGPARRLKPSERLRQGRLAADGLSFVAVERGRLVGTLRLWNVAIGAGRPALLLGPLGVAADARGRGIGSRLMRHALREARKLGHRAVILCGDAPYYGRFGFSADAAAAIRMPGPHDPARLLARELVPGALAGAGGVVRAAGVKVPQGLPAFIIAPAYARCASTPARLAQAA